MSAVGLREQRVSYPALDGLRGIGALWVLVGHVAQVALYDRYVWILLNNGLAVDLFMLLSGFLMFMLHGHPSRLNAVNFWIRRFFRLAPLYYSCLLFGFILSPLLSVRFPAVWSVAPHLHGWALDMSASNMLIHTTFLFGLSPTYQENTFLPDWSLSLEAQFYLAFPLLVLCMSRFGVLTTAAAIVGLQMASVLLFPGLFGDYIFPTLLPMKLHMFLAGMLLAQVARADRPHPAFYALLVACAALPLPFFDARYAICRVVMIALVLACTRPDVLPLARPLVAALSRPVMRWLGDISYGVYLVHMLIMYPAFFLFLGSLEAHPTAVFWAVLALTLSASLALAAICHRYVERPGIALGRRLTDRLAPRLAAAS